MRRGGGSKNGRTGFKKKKFNDQLSFHGTKNIFAVCSGNPLCTTNLKWVNFIQSLAWVKKINGALKSEVAI